MSKEIEEIIEDLKECVDGNGVPNIHFINNRLIDLEKKNNELLKSHSDWMSIALERKDEITKLNEIIKEAINLPKGVEPHSYSDYLTNNTNK